MAKASKTAGIRITPDASSPTGHARMARNGPPDNYQTTPASSGVRDAIAEFHRRRRHRDLERVNIDKEWGLATINRQQARTMCDC